MQSYPIGKSSFAISAVSASVAGVASFATLKVATASFALNAPGPSGSSGSAFTNTGQQGPTGPTGPTGPKGLGIYLLSSTLGSCCTRFDSFGVGWIGTTDTSGFGQCDTGKYTYSIGSFIYSTCGSLVNGCKVYSNSSCITTLPYNAITDGSGTYYELNGSGEITNDSGVCSL
jgi:hypothetical protein